jgi:hypothetical protein
MSNAGQAILGIVGGIIGFWVGGPTGAAYGFQLGYLAGTAIFPTQLPHMQGPRMGDGQTTTSVVGHPIPVVFGTQTVGGNVIWASPYREVANTETQGGKGAPEQDVTQYSYYRSFAILICEGPIAGVRRVWANGKIEYDRSEPASEEPVEDILDDVRSLLAQALIGTAAQSDAWAEKMTIYLGTEDQLPDPVMESFLGVGNVPAHRGYAYVVFDDVLMKPEDGNRMPGSWKFEVYTEGSSDANAADAFSNEVMYPWTPADVDPRNAQNTHEYQLVGTSSFVANFGVVLTAPVRSTLDAALGDFLVSYGYEGPTSGDAIGWSIGPDSDTWTSNMRPVTADGLPENRAYTYMHFNEDAVGVLGYYPQLPYLGDCEACFFAGCGYGGLSKIWWGDRYLDLPGSIELENQFEIGVYEIDDIDNATDRQVFNNNCVFIGPGDQQLLLTPDVIIEVRRVPQAPPDPCEIGTPITGVPDWVLVEGELLQCGPWTLDGSTTYKVLQKFSEGNTPTVVTMPLNPARPLGHPQYNDEDFWTAAYEIEVARGRMAAGLVYGVDYPQTQAFGYRKSMTVNTTSTTPVSLASIVAALCERTGLTSYDVSDLETEYVVGYQVSRPMATRAAIEPLRSIGFFDVIESGNALKFSTRGKAPVATLEDGDMGARPAESPFIPAITTKRTQPFELPRQVRIHYQNPDRDFDPGEELSPARFDSAAEGVTDIDIGAAVGSDKAAQIAEVLYRDIWAARWSHQTQVDQNFSAIEPGDVLLVPVDGRLERMRVPGLMDRLPNLRVFEMVRDDDGSYVSTAVGTTSQRTPARLPFYGPVEALLLDLPPLQVTDDDPGIYAAVYPMALTGDFRGAIFSRSLDGGNYTVVGSATTLTPAGRIWGALPEGPTTVFDEGNALIVELAHGELESRTEEDVLAGANAAAVGGDGRWEVIQFRDAVNTAGNVWRLTGLLRGRKGTEHAVGQSVDGDTFVMLSLGTLIRLPLTIDQVDIEHLYKITPVGTSPEGVTPEEFTGHGIALKPWSPVHVEGSRNTGGDLTITWMRRDRLATDVDDATPMSESVEDYEIDILTALGEVRRTISVSEATASYTAEQQTVDFGEPQDSLSVVVYQISTAVGRGYPAEATI